MLLRDILLLDLETTGLSPESDRIVQLASIILDKGDLTEKAAFSMLVRTDVPVSEGARRVHGHTKQSLQSAASIETVVARFDRFAPRDVYIAGHNVAFDVAFLRATYKRLGVPFEFDYHYVDLWSVAYFVLNAAGVRLEKYNLNALCSFSGVERDPRHDALQDVRASAAIVRYLFDVVRSSSPRVRGQFDLFRSDT